MVGSYAFNQNTTRCATTKMIIIHKYILAMVDNIGFKEFVLLCNLYLMWFFVTFIKLT